MDELQKLVAAYIASDDLCRVTAGQDVMSDEDDAAHTAALVAAHRAIRSIARLGVRGPDDAATIAGLIEHVVRETADGGELPCRQVVEPLLSALSDAL